MSGTAIVMMIVAIVLVWGGLVLALINIKRSPEEVDELDDPEDVEPGPESSEARHRGEPAPEPVDATTTPHGTVTDDTRA